MEPESTTVQSKRLRRLIGSLLLALAVIVGIYISDHQQLHQDPPPTSGSQTVVNSQDVTYFETYKLAVTGLNALAVKGRAPKTGYTRTQFGNGWEKSGDCDTRNRILARDLSDVFYEVNSCIVVSGSLNDPYTGTIIPFSRGKETSSRIQIDHVVALSDAWQKGAQLLTPELRQKLANDGLNLLAVDGPTNMNKGDGDTATWLPPNKSVRCQYVARQISVKLKYALWVTGAEKTAMQNILKACPSEPLVH